MKRMNDFFFHSILKNDGKEGYELGSPFRVNPESLFEGVALKVELSV